MFQDIISAKQEPVFCFGLSLYTIHSEHTHDSFMCELQTRNASSGFQNKISKMLFKKVENP